MSFLDEQATGQIGIGEKASLGTLTRTRRRRKKGQRPQGTEPYSLTGQIDFTDIVSSPTDITQVGIGQLLTAQGIPASQVRNVFERYQDTGAAPIGDVGDVLYPQPEDDGNGESYTDGDIETQTDPYIPDADAGIGEATEGFGGYTPPPAAIIDPESTGGKIFSRVVGAIDAAARAAQSAVPGGRTGREPGVDSMVPPDKTQTAVPMLDLTGGITFEGITPVAPPTPPASLPSPVNVGLDAPPPSAPGPGDANFEFGTPGDYGIPSGPGDAAGATDGINFGDDNANAIDSFGFASGGTVKSKNKNSFMSMKGK